jgi:tetraacyldisaccharide 4'-kinase
MNFSYLQKGIRLLLFPFSLLVWGYISVRNLLYDKGWRFSSRFNLPLIAVGNLSVGGTGKSPMVEYLLALLNSRYAVATLSRGYKRKTAGYLLATEHTTALEIGDEPMQFHRKFPGVAVAVGEARVEAIPQLLHDRPQTQVIVLDDAFQHRAIAAGLNIVLTDFSNPYWHDWYLPTGELRDNKRSAQRAQVIIVTKCPPNMAHPERQAILDQMNPLPGQQVFFTSIAYGQPYHIVDGTPFTWHEGFELLLVCGIANPGPLKKYVEQHTAAYIEKSYPDHHVFTIDDWFDIENRFKTLNAPGAIVLTTEKDAVRLLKFGHLLAQQPVYVVPISPRFLFDEADRFNQIVLNFIENFARAAPPRA